MKMVRQDFGMGSIVSIEPMNIEQSLELKHREEEKKNEMEIMKCMKCIKWWARDICVRST